MKRKNYELIENILTVFFAIIAAADAVLIILTKGGLQHAFEGEELFETIHQIVQSLFITTVVLCSLTLLIRWHRHHEEMLEAMELSKEIVQENKVAEHLKEIIQNCREIRQKGWPEFAQNYLTEELLEDLKTSTHQLKIGSMKCSLVVGRMYSPGFFKITKGPSFVTHYGEWDYWSFPAGLKQLKANRNAITNHGPITRYFILRDCDGVPEDNIIKNQLDAKINLYVVHENEVNKRFLCDVGVFFDEDGKIVFLSEWYFDSDSQKDPEKNFAALTLEGQRLTFGLQVYDHFDSNNYAKPIRGPKDWEDYKANRLNRTSTKSE